MKKLAYGIVLAFAAMSAAVAFATGERIPAGYTEIEYIQGNGSNARIVTDYTPQPNIDKIEAVVECPANTIAANVNQAIWCARGNGLSVDSWTLFILGTQFRFDYMPSGNAVSLTPDFPISTGTKYTITAEDNTVTYSANGSVLQTQSTPAYSYTAGSVLALFASHHTGINANVSNYGKHKLYSFKVWRSDGLIHYFVPCKDANNAATLVDICDNPATLTKSGTFTAGQEGHYYDDSLLGDLTILPIPDQVNETFEPCRPEFVVSNKDTSATYTIGGNIASPLFDVAYINNIGVGKATVTATGKGEYAGEKLTAKFNIVATKLEDENISTLDISVKRHIVDGKYVYVFTDAASAQVVTAKRNLAMTDCLLVGGGGAGGGKTGGGGGAGGVTNAANLGASAFVAKNGTFTVTVGAGGTHNNNPQSKGGNGGTTSIVFGEFSASVAGGGGGGSWNNGGGVAGASGGGGSQNAVGGKGTAGIGNAGATGLGVNTCRSGGGGGAGHAGYQADTTANHSGYGGEGVSNNITGAWVVYGGGGGGGGGKGVSDSTTLTPGLGGLGGGGNGGSSANNGNGNPGTDGLGGGGGGGNIGGNGNNGGRGGQGGSGTVILVVNPNDLEVELTDQVWESFDPCRPELTVSNAVNGAHWTVGGDIASEYFDVEYVNNVGVGTARVDITGKGACAGLSWSGSFDILATKYEDANITTTDLTAKRLEVDGRYVYVFTNTVSAQTVTANRMIALDEFLLVGGGGGGGRTRGGGGGAGGVTNAAGVVGIVLRKNETFTLAVGAGGAGGANESYAGGKGGDTALEFGLFAVTVPGGGGGAGWGIKTGAKGGSGGGGANGAAGGAGYSGFGFAGAASLGGNNRSGGGGGAGHAGYQADATANRAGNGGEGVSNRITGAWIVYGGGGGAGGSNNGYYNPAAGLGGLGGGGDGSKGIDGNPGTDGLGGGGGGGGYGGGPSGYSSTYSGLGGNGGSGIAILAIKATDFMVDPIPDQVLAGGVSEPLPVVRTADGETLLAKDKDYTVSYKDNDKGGIATVTITGINGYDGKSIELFFKITSRIYAKPSVASEGDGTSWANAMSAAKAFETLAHASGYNEIWMQEGTVFQPAFSVTNSGALVIRGGFAGTETTLEDRQPGTLTVFNGENTATVLLRVSDVLAADTVIDRVKFYRAKSNGLVKTGGGTIRVYDCVVEANGRNVSEVYGRGMNVQSDGSGSLVVSNCVFAGNRSVNGDKQWGGFGLYVKSFKNALIDNSLFVTNGYDLTKTPSSAYVGYLNARGSALLVDSTPITIRNSRFAGNCCPVRKKDDTYWCGGTIALNGACGGSVIDHCALIGNTELYSIGDEGSNSGGAIAIRLNASAAKVAVRNCTIAYNLTQSPYSSGGITVYKGSADISNTVLWKNLRYHTTSLGYGRDLHVASSYASATIRNSTVTSLDPGDECVVGATVDEESVFALDPKLVTSTAVFESLLTQNATGPYFKPTTANPTVYEDLAGMDAHLLSPAGYFVNGGAVGPATSDYSMAIDLGDPDADYANEPVPNGSRLNLGAYGNTAEASCTATGQPEANVAVTFPDGMTRPKVTVTMGLESGTGYSATVQLVCKVGGEVLAVENYSRVGSDDVIEYLLPQYLPVGTVVTAVAIIAASGAETIVRDGTGTAAGEVPAFYGKGGGPNVIHVRTGADCKMDGSNWMDAYPDLRTALASAPDASKTEIWLSVTNDHMNASVTLVGSITVRGGFTGVENSAAERPEGLFSTLDGVRCNYKTMDFSVPSGALLTVERIRFSHSSGPGLRKTGSGDLTVRDCYFTDRKQSDWNLLGGGIYASGGTVSVANCQFVHLIDYSVNALSYNSYGGDGIYLSSCTQAYIDDCLFATNGVQFYRNKGAQARHPGSAVYVNATPTIFRNCRFASNGSAVMEQTGCGGAVFFNGACGGSKMINCTLVGNADFEGSQSSAEAYGGGAVYCVMSSAAATLDIENCTIAYNLTQGKWAGAGINVGKGTVNLKNSVIYGNVRGRTNIAEIAGADIEVKADGSLNMSYTLVTGLTSNYIHSVNAENLTIGPGVIYDIDPLLATTTNDFWKLFTKYNETVYIAQAKRGDCAKIDVHPRTRTGYIKDGVLIRDPERVESPTIDKGDPTSDYSKEPQLIGIGGNGGRVNLGFSGNTPEAALTRRTGSVYYLR